MTYYKYQEIESEDVLDWGQIGKNISETIDKIDENREKRRDEIDATYEEFQNKLADAPLGEHKGINNQILDYSSDVQNSATYAHKMLKAGKWNTRQYQQFMQSLSDNSEQLLDVFTTGNTYYDEILQGVQDGSLSGINGFLADQNNSLYKLVDTKWVIDPVTGQTAIAKYKIDENGDKVLDMDNLVSIKDLENRLKKRYDSYDVEGNLKQRADLFAKKFETLSKDKGIRSMDDIRQLTKMGKDGKEVSIYESVVESSINSMLASPMNEQSILYDYLKFDENGEEYIYSNNPEDKGKENVIYFDYDNKTGQPNIQLTDNQRKYMKEQLRDRLDSMIGRSLNLPQQFAPQQPSASLLEYKAGVARDDTKFQRSVDMVGKLWHGDEEDMASAMEYFTGIRDDISRMEKKRNKEGMDVIEITLKNGNKEYLSLTNEDGTPKDQKEFIQSATILTGKENAGRDLTESMFDPTKKYSNAYTGRTTRVAYDPVADAKESIRQIIGDPVKFSSKENDEVIATVQKIASALGGVAETDWELGNAEIIKIKVNGEEKELNLQDPSQAENNLQVLLSFVNDQLDKEYVADVAKRLKSEASGSSNKPDTSKYNK